MKKVTVLSIALLAGASHLFSSQDWKLPAFIGGTVGLGVATEVSPVIDGVRQYSGKSLVLGGLAGIASVAAEYAISQSLVWGEENNARKQRLKTGISTSCFAWVGLFSGAASMNKCSEKYAIFHAKNEKSVIPSAIAASLGALLASYGVHGLAHSYLKDCELERIVQCYSNNSFYDFCLGQEANHWWHSWTMKTVLYDVGRAAYFAASLQRNALTDVEQQNKEWCLALDNDPCVGEIVQTHFQGRQGHVVAQLKKDIQFCARLMELEYTEEDNRPPQISGMNIACRNQQDFEALQTVINRASGWMQDFDDRPLSFSSVMQSVLSLPLGYVKAYMRANWLRRHVRPRIVLLRLIKLYNQAIRCRNVGGGAANGMREGLSEPARQAGLAAIERASHTAGRE